MAGAGHGNSLDVTLDSYEELRDRYRPERTELLLIGESAPDSSADERRFFYAETLAAQDNLFRGVIEACYGHRFPKGSAGVSKTEWLTRLRRDGTLLIDVAPFPVNKLGKGERVAAVRAHAPAAVQTAMELEPHKIAVCHTKTFWILAPLLRDRGLPLAHDEPIPFPWGNWRADFVAKLREVGCPAGAGASSQEVHLENIT